MGRTLVDIDCHPFQTYHQGLLAELFGFVSDTVLRTFRPMSLAFGTCSYYEVTMMCMATTGESGDYE